MDPSKIIGIPRTYTAAQCLYAIRVCEGDNVGKYVMLQDEDGSVASVTAQGLDTNIFLVWPTPEADVVAFELKHDAQRVVDTLNKYARDELKNNDQFCVQPTPVRMAAS